MIQIYSQKKAHVSSDSRKSLCWQKASKQSGGRAKGLLVKTLTRFLWGVLMWWSLWKIRKDITVADWINSKYTFVWKKMQFYRQAGPLDAALYAERQQRTECKADFFI